MTDPRRRATRLVHAGARVRSQRPPAGTAIYQTAPFVFEDCDELEAAFADPGQRGVYSRLANPTIEAVEACLAAVEGAEDALVLSSGMAAVAALVQGLVGPGDRMLVGRELYGGTRGWLDWLATANPAVAVEVRPLADVASAVEELDPRPRLVLVETPTNPLLECTDVASLAASCRRREVLLAVDNTFATPVLQNPLELGADLVLHSASKFLGGHSDLVAGAVAGRRELLAAVRRQRTLGGAALDPHAGFLLLRGMRTLELRVERQSANAARLAEIARSHPVVEEVRYPGWTEVGRRQMRAGGGIVALRLATEEAARALLDRLDIVSIMPSLGGVESAAVIPAISSHRHLDEEERVTLGIGGGLVRLSCGIEAGDDLEADLRRALDSL